MPQLKSFYSACPGILQSIGLGTTLCSVLQICLDEIMSTSNLVLFVLGIIVCIGGLLLEYKQRTSIEPIEQESKIRLIAEQRKDKSHNCLSRILKYSAGYAIMTAIIQLCYGQDVLLGTISLCAVAYITSVAFVELEDSIYFPKPPIVPFAGIRLMGCFGDDLFVIGCIQHTIDDDLRSFDTFLLFVGLLLWITEALISHKNDFYIMASNIARRRLMKMSIGAGTIFTLVNVIVQSNHPYRVFNDIYIIINNFLLVFAFIKLRHLEEDPKPFPEELISKEKINSLFEKDILQMFEIEPRHISVESSYHRLDDRKQDDDDVKINV